MKKNLKYPKTITYALKLGLFLTLYSIIIVLLSVVLKNSVLAMSGIVLFFVGFGFIASKLLIEERQLNKRLKHKKAK
jgi:hypothetical protein